MFRIPHFYEEAFCYEDAVTIMKAFGRGDLLEGMKAMDRCWEEYLASQGKDNARFKDDDAFYENYCYEVNAFNKVFSEMKQLFI
jgi:hypothetical protein